MRQLQNMAITDDHIAKVLKLVPAHSTVEHLRAADDLQDLTITQIHEALDILKERGQVKSGGMFRRD
jgi:hypothetical protein